MYGNYYRVQPSYVYGSPYLGAATSASASAAGLVPIQATQLSHAAALAAATNQFYEYQVSFLSFFLTATCRCNIIGYGEFNFFFFFKIYKQNAVAAAAATPYPGQYAGFEAYPYAASAAGN